jgi:hypothetical protein
MNNERNGLNKLLHVRRRKLTLLEKVGECNVIVGFLFCSYKPSIYMPFVCIHKVILNVLLISIVCETSWTAVTISPRRL